MNRLGDRPVPERNDGGDALDAELLRQLGVGVHVDLHQFEGTVGFERQVLESGAEHLARPAPLSPEVDDDGDLVAALEHRLRKVGGGDVADVIGGVGHRFACRERR